MSKASVKSPWFSNVAVTSLKYRFSDDFLEYATLARVIKYKWDHKSEMTDTGGLIVVDAFHGRGKQLGHIALCC